MGRNIPERAGGFTLGLTPGEADIGQCLGIEPVEAPALAAKRQHGLHAGHQRGRALPLCEEAGEGVGVLHDAFLSVMNCREIILDAYV